MTINDLIFILLPTFGIAFLILWRFKQYRIDEFRQNIFKLRDELFDYAADGNIEFNDPAYITLRNLLNGYIRFSHRISLIHAILILYVEARYNEEYKAVHFDAVWGQVTAKLDPKVKWKLNNFESRASSNLFYYVFLSTTLKKLFFVPMLVFIAVKTLLSSKKRKEFLLAWQKHKEIKEETFKITKANSGQFAHSIENLNTDALFFGSKGAVTC